MTPEPAAKAVVETLVQEGALVVCAGPGGVGKTTTAAALALAAAKRGRKACVVTIDPARRLADALGLSALTNEPRRVEGDWPGELWALMLDTKSTFDDLVDRYSESDEQARRIKSNDLYRNISGALSGTQEYMAAEKLYELSEEGVFDLIVVDTPPTRNALDFLDAPGRLMRLLENRFFRMLVLPTRTYLRAMSAGLRTLLRAVSTVVGTDVVNDVIAFFQAFEGMEEGFRKRAERVQSLLEDPRTTFVLVTSPHHDRVTEASWFVERLKAAGMSVSVLIANRVHPRFREPDGGPFPSVGGLEELRQLLVNLEQLESAAESEEAALDQLRKDALAPLRSVPLLDGDVHDIAGLEVVARHLTGE